MFETIKELIKGTKFENNTFLVGGCVRDQIMGVKPDDYDIVVSLPNGGIELAEYITKTTDCYSEGSNPVIYPTYGTAMFQIKTDEHLKNIQFEVVQTRKEQYHSDSRNPECVFGTIEDDAFRRDLTINSLYRNLSTDVILDPTEMGLDDIKNKIIRTTSDPSIIFSDDPLRMLRVIRFASRYYWKIDINTYNGIVKNAHRIKIITRERITKEFYKLLLCKIPSYGFNMLLDTGLLKEIDELSILSQFQLIEQNKYHFGNLWEHTMSVLDKTKPILLNRYAALLHDIGKYYTRSVDENGNVHFLQHETEGLKVAKEIMLELKNPNSLIEGVLKVIKYHMKTKEWGNDPLKVKDWKIRKLQYELKNDLECVLDVIDADNKSHANEYCLPNQVDNIRLKLKEMKSLGMDCSKINLPINGNDIMNHLNINGGKILGEIIDHLILMYIKNPLKYQSHENCLKEVKSYYKNKEKY
jgi:putative nucleotidyltransferase with HDIG domain